MRNSARSNIIVVGVDESTSATSAVAWATAEARRRDAALHLVHGYAPPTAGADTQAHPGTQTLEKAKSAGQTLLDEMRSAANEIDPGVTVTTELDGDAVDALRAASENAILTVVGAQHRAPAADLLFGSVSSRLAGHAPCPVVVVPAAFATDGQPGSGPIVVGLDETPTCQDALAFAFEEAAFRDVPLIAVHSWDEQPLDSFLTSYPLLVDESRIANEENRMLAEQLAGWSEKYPEVDVRAVVVQGRPDTMLAATTDSSGAQVKPSLIVVGAHGAAKATHMVPGSTSHALTTHSHFPVAVVRGSAVG